VLASTASPIESVYIGSGELSKSVVAAQQECSQRFDDPSCSKQQVPIDSSALGDALAYTAATSPFAAAAWLDPQQSAAAPHLPLLLPAASSNPLKRATAAWRQQQLEKQQGAFSAAGYVEPGGDGSAPAVTQGLPPFFYPPLCMFLPDGAPPGGSPKCGGAPTITRASQMKLRLFGGFGRKHRLGGGQ